MSQQVAHGRARSVRTLLALVTVVAAGLLPQARAVRASSPFPAVARPSPRLPAAIPLAFEPNRGQANANVAFIARGSAYTAYLSQSRATFDLFVSESISTARSLTPGLPPAMPAPRVAARAVGLRFPGTSGAAQIAGVHRLSGIVNYLIGNDPRRWHTNIPTYAAVEVRNLYPGIDVLYHSRNGQLEYDWTLRAGARVGAIRMELAGAGSARLTPAGAIAVSTQAGTLIQERPTAYQLTPGGRRSVRVTYTGSSCRGFGMRIEPHDASKPLIVDPVVSFATYLGGPLGDAGRSIAVDPAGNVYVAGLTASPGFPTRNPYPYVPVTGPDTPPHVFVTKLDPAGTGLVFSTYLGGTAFDEAFGIAEDATGVYVTGATESADFPTVHAFQPKLGGGTDAFIAKLNPAGNSLVYSSYVGGPQNDTAYGLAIDPSGQAYITGDTSPVGGGSGANAPGSHPHAFVDKLTADGSPIYTMLLAGDLADTGYGIAADARGDAYVVGMTESQNFPSPQSQPPGLIGPEDGYVVRIDPTGKTILYSTHLGGNDVTVADAVAVDAQGNAYVVGQTAASNFPVVGGFQKRYGGGRASLTPGDAFIARLDGSGRIRYSSYLGGGGDDEALSVAVDTAHDIYVTGWTDSANFPVKDAIQPGFTGTSCYSGRLAGPCSDAFATRITSGGQLSWSTYLGGSGTDYGNGIAISSGEAVYVAGTTSSQDWPTVHAFEARSPDTQLGALNAFIVKLVAGAPPPNDSLVIDGVQVFHKINGRLAPTNVVRLGEIVHVVVTFHDRVGSAHRAFATVSLTRRGHELLQRAMHGATTAGTTRMGASFAFSHPGDVGAVTARVAVISGGVTAIKTVSFAVA
jgi:hypothetical protein